jgi:hypothetical protein
MDKVAEKDHWKINDGDVTTKINEVDVTSSCQENSTIE